ncbi:MAG: flagellar hook protein FlgE [Firmicutes bacterium]|nr:flagellar hook protein FlgE [Bacillota bacterium]
MMRSLFSGVSGLRNHQIRMDVIGNNIANVNTIGYKGSRVTFRDLLYQTMSGSAAPQGNRGGINPQQVGLGVAVGSIDVIQTGGSSETTGQNTDMMIEGDGFFVLQDGSRQFYTRAGAFKLDFDGNLTSPSGLKVAGWMANSGGVLPNLTATNLQGIVIQKGMQMAPSATTTASFIGNLDSRTAALATFDTTLPVYDSLGNKYDVSIRFTKLNTPNEWNWEVTNPPWLVGAAKSRGSLAFDALGVYTGTATVDAARYTPADITGTPPGGANLLTIPIASIDFSGLRQYATESGIDKSQNGYAQGSLNDFSVDATGVVTGLFSNGRNQPIAQVAMAVFNNPGGLSRSGETLFEETNNSGLAQIGSATTGGRGKITPGSVEMSNVDLSQEFTNMIVTQRGFQANSRIITTSDEMLQELVNLKR